MYLSINLAHYFQIIYLAIIGHGTISASSRYLRSKTNSRSRFIKILCFSISNMKFQIKSWKIAISLATFSQALQIRGKIGKIRRGAGNTDLPISKFLRSEVFQLHLERLVIRNSGDCGRVEVVTWVNIAEGIVFWHIR